MLHIPTIAATTLSAYRNIEWWNQEKQKKEGVRVKHTHQYFARLMNAERLLDVAAGNNPWRGHLPDWLALSDVEWASGRQLALN